MNQSPENRSDAEETIEDIAAAWLVQREEGFSADQAEEFARWRRDDPRHEQAVATMEATHQVLLRLPEVREDLPETASESSGRIQPATGATAGASTRVVRFPTLLKAIAAAAACFALAAAVWLLRAPKAERIDFAQAYTTADAGFQRVQLPDGSVLELNANTELRVQFSNTTRRIGLARGEAHFTVAPNAARPFLVAAGSVSVRAVGTAFNVRLSEKQVDVLVTEGRVEVSREAQRAAPQLTAGQRVSVPLEAATGPIALVEPVSQPTIDQALAWQKPLFVFRAESLSQVVERFNRYNRVQLSISDAALGARLVGGTFRADQVEVFVRLLQDSGDIAVERPSAYRIVLRSGAR